MVRETSSDQPGVRDDAVLMRRRAHAWAEGAREGRTFDRLLAKKMTYAERLAEGLALTRIAMKLQSGRRIARKS